MNLFLYLAAIITSLVSREIDGKIRRGMYRAIIWPLSLKIYLTIKWHLRRDKIIFEGSKQRSFSGKFFINFKFPYAQLLARLL